MNGENVTGPCDLDAFKGLGEAQEAGIDVEIQYDGKSIGPTGLRIRIAGVDSKRFRSIKQDLFAEDVERENLAPLTLGEQEDRQIRMFARCTIAWSPIIFGGNEIPCTEQNALMLYRHPDLQFIRTELELKAGRRSSFMPRSAVVYAEHSEISETASASDSQ